MSAEEPPDLTDEERATYEWQMWVEDFGEAGQRRLKNASVLVSRVGGVGGTAAYYLAAAGIGRLVLAHGGDVRPSDLNRQLLMTHAAIGTSRIASAEKRLRELNPRLDIVAVNDQVSDANASGLVAQCDVVVACAPRFSERLAMNRAAVQQGKPLVNCAMYDLQGELTCVLPGRSACLACLTPEEPPTWKREFPVFGAVAGMIGAMGAMEAIKLIAGIGQPLAGRLMMIDLRTMVTRTMTIARDPQCPVCGVKAER
ncbi:MAG: HesA/MoeB/ThiF family protein [Planctomycetes bacterium]|nr:HesA/MoeB/ThiF family protein [Planctomycetota bacterium]